MVHSLVSLALIETHEPNSSVTYSMEPNIFSILSKKVINTIIAIGSMFYSAIDGVNAEFDEISLRTENEHILVSSHLMNCFTEELDQIFGSGRKIEVNFLVEVFELNNNRNIVELSFYHVIKYSLIEDSYEVYQSESREFASGLDLKQAKTVLVYIRDFPAITSDRLRKDEEYFVKLTAWMNEIRLQGMEEPLNLMYYWNSIKPTRESKHFTTDIIAQ